MPVNKSSTQTDPIPAVVMVRGNLCCIVIDLLAISEPRFVWDADRGALLCGPREVKFPSPKSFVDFRERLSLGADQVAVIEVGAAGQVIREHQIIEPPQGLS